MQFRFFFLPKSYLFCALSWLPFCAFFKVRFHWPTSVQNATEPYVYPNSRPYVCTYFSISSSREGAKRLNRESPKHECYSRRHEVERQGNNRTIQKPYWDECDRDFSNRCEMRDKSFTTKGVRSSCTTIMLFYVKNVIPRNSLWHSES